MLAVWSAGREPAGSDSVPVVQHEGLVAVTLVEFLEARLADDLERAEFVQRQWEGYESYEPWRLSWHDEYDLLCVEPVRMIAEVAAKREVIALHQTSQERDRLLDRVILPSVEVALGLAVKHLAAVYADHPDYDPAWRP